MLLSFFSFAMQDRDLLHRFIFEHTAIRGNRVHLQQSMIMALQHHPYPAALRVLLGELMAAALLLISTLKMHGALTLQIQGRGALKLLVVECRRSDTDDLTLRATAKFDDNLPVDNLLALLADGQCVISLQPEEADATGYQSVVALEGHSISRILENYMRRSEQIETSIWLASDGRCAAGMLLQKLPDQQETDLDAWERVNILAETVHNDELLTLPGKTLLGRLFHGEDVRLYPGQHVAFLCRCSRRSVGNMLRMLGQIEVKNIIEEHGKLEVSCDFCGQQYGFDQIDSERLFLLETSVPTSTYHH